MSTNLLDLIKPWVIVLIFVIIIILCTTGNSLVLYVILTKKHMQTVTNCFIASLSVSDLLIGFVVVSLATVQTVKAGAIYGAACQMPIYIESVCCTASVYSLLAISFDRYMAVIHSTMKTFTRQKSMYVIIGVWVWSFLYSSKIFILFAVVTISTEYNNGADEDDDVEFCNLLVEEEDDDFWFRVADAIILFVLPFATMTFMYIRISRRLWFSGTAVNTAIRNKRKVVKFLIYDVILFFFSWAPFYTVELVTDGLRLLSMLSEEEEEALESARWYLVLRFVFIVLALTNSFFNPVLYAFFNGNFQAEIKATFRRYRGKVAPQTSNLLTRSMGVTAAFNTISGQPSMNQSSTVSTRAYDKREHLGMDTHQGDPADSDCKDAGNNDWRF